MAKLTVVKLSTGSSLNVLNIVYGYDIGDEWVHVTTNIHPPGKDGLADFFFTDEIQEIIAPEEDEIIFKK